MSTGRALEAYLRHERPKTSDEAVFVRRLAPHDEPIGVDAIRRIVRDAFRRADPRPLSACTIALGAWITFDIVSVET